MIKEVCELLSTMIRNVFFLAKLAHLSGQWHGDGLDLGVSLQAVLSKLATGTALLESAKGCGSREDVVAVKPEKLV